MSEVEDGVQPTPDDEPTVGPDASDIDASQTDAIDMAAPGIADALAGLADLESTPLAQHPDVYQRIHSTLQGALAEIDGN